MTSKGVKNCKCALAVHMTRKHGVFRAVRKKVVGPGCPVCLRKFGGRGACLNHIHRTSNDTCLINLLLFYPDAPGLAAAEADQLQYESEAAARKLGEAPQFTGLLARQMEGPLERIVIPNGSSRKSRYPLMQAMLKDPEAACEVDFDELRISLYSDQSDQSDQLDSVPIAMHPEFKL